MKKEEHSEAKSIIDTLVKKGFIAYYAGGWVRDYLLGIPSDDIDIATSALPKDIQDLFDKTVPIGIQFGIILVIVDDKQFEVATFRSDLEYKDGRRPTKIAFTSPKEDAVRRDFTINGMFYDPIKEEIIDFVQGNKDLEKKIIRAIGNAHDRFKEDRLRMIRAVRLAARLGFTIEKTTEKAILLHAPELFPAVAIERIVQELKKMSAYPNFTEALLKLHDYGLLGEIFPDLKKLSTDELKKRLIHLPDFPHHLPMMGYLLELFNQPTLNFAKALAQKLKLPNQEIRFTEFYFAHEHTKSDYEWVHFYANPFSHPVLQIWAARMPIDKRKAFEKTHEDRKKTLEFYIQSMQQSKPLVTSHHLIKVGIKPGEEMGKILKEAEKIAIEKKLDSAEDVLKHLKLL